MHVHVYEEPSSLTCFWRDFGPGASLPSLRPYSYITEAAVSKNHAEVLGKRTCLYMHNTCTYLSYSSVWWYESSRAGHSICV